MILNREKWNFFPQKSSGCPFYPYLLSIELKVLARVKRHLQEIIKGIEIGEEEVTVSLFADNVTLYEKALKTPPGNFYSWYHFK